ncbi:MAG: HAD hydrolase-like protein [Gemmatimonadota bacterium]|nr:MAG: HAD hydrolase-like protein [Gemmatimonadota bacterium]
MSTSDALAAMDYDIVTFDCYGTLIDWETGISDAIMTYAREAGVSLQREQVIRAYHEVEPAVEAAEYRRYKDVLRDTAMGVAHGFGWALEEEQAAFLADSLPHWPPFSDTNTALELMKDSGYQLGILSNVDDDLLHSTLNHFTVEFDLLITAQRVGSYKPAHGHFLRAQEMTVDLRWLHAAQSYFHDIEPAYDLGIPVAWVNRKAEEPWGHARPDYEMATLESLAAILCD